MELIYSGVFSVCKVLSSKWEKIEWYGQELLFWIIAIVIFGNLYCIFKFIMVRKIFNRIKRSPALFLHQLDIVYCRTQ